MGLNLHPKSYIILWLLSAILFVAYNELVILPYQTWNPSLMVTMEEMSLRNPFINLGLILGAYGILSYGLIVFVEFMQVSNGYGYEQYLNGSIHNEGFPKRG